ncbi:Uncharacterized protein Fot_40151 [Forsythia ovata]|uniref:Uncharacterized protein n=1 Tax=Forsythia ovata TaxID=205694 RepID=A0ABD1S875_9LAMI
MTPETEINTTDVFRDLKKLFLTQNGERQNLGALMNSFFKSRKTSVALISVSGVIAQGSLGYGDSTPTAFHVTVVVFLPSVRGNFRSPERREIDYLGPLCREIDEITQPEIMKERPRDLSFVEDSLNFEDRVHWPRIWSLECGCRVMKITDSQAIGSAEDHRFTVESLRAEDHRLSPVAD